ncbi:MAG: ABC transporter ATP-binding protein [Parashewanella sp.]
MSEHLNGLHCRIDTQSPLALTAQFDCQAGELIAILGSSGSGKTSLLKLLAGLIKPESGSITFNGKVWLDTQSKQSLSPQQRKIGYVPQHFGLFEHQTALENICSGLSHLAKQDRIQQAEHWLNLVGLQQQCNLKPKQLSGGQRQRVALARALAREPDVLLLDEPFSAVDSQTRESLHLELLKLKGSINCPVLMVTHNAHEAMMLAQKVIIFEHGKILQQGVTAEVQQSPNSDKVAKLLGYRNVLSAQVIEHNPKKQQTIAQIGDHQLMIIDDVSRLIGESIQCIFPNISIPMTTEALVNHLPIQLLSHHQYHNNIQAIGYVENTQQKVNITLLSQQLANDLPQNLTWSVAASSIKIIKKQL